jgi:predicted MFS family arabinose efflux permease
MSAALIARRGVQFTFLVIATSSVALASRAVSPLQEGMRTALSLSDMDMSLLQGPALSLPIVLLAIPLGFLIDRLPRVRLLLLLAACNMMGCFLTVFASSFLQLFVARAVVGLTTTALTITGFSLLADLFPAEQRGRAKAAIGVGQQVATSVAFAAGGALLTLYGLNNGWQWALFWLTCPLLVAVTLLMLAMREPPRVGGKLQQPSSRDSLAEIWQCRATILPVLGAIFFIEVSVFAWLTWAAPSLARGFDLPPARVGALMATATVAGGLVGPIFGGMLADWCQRTGGPRLTLTLLMILPLLSACGASFSMAPTVVSAGALLIFFNLMVTATISMGTTLFMIVVPNELRGVCLSLLAVSASIGATIGPVMVSALSAATSSSAQIGVSLSIVCAASSVLCAAMFLLARRGVGRSV